MPPANQGTSSGGSSIPALSHTHTDLLLAGLPRFSPAPSCSREAGAAQPRGKAAPARSPRGTYPAYSSAAAAGSAGSSEERLQPLVPQPLRLLPQAGRRDRRKEGAESPAQSKAPSLGALGVPGWKGFCAMFHCRASLLCLRHPLALGSSFQGSGSHSYLCRCHPDSPHPLESRFPQSSECSQHSGISQTLLLPAELQHSGPGSPEIPAFTSGTQGKKNQTVCVAQAKPGGPCS